MLETIRHRLFIILYQAAKTIIPISNEEMKAFATALIRGKRYYCPVCNRRLWRFEMAPFSMLKDLDKYGYVHSAFTNETANFFAYGCPFCSASDRDRLYALYFKQEFSKINVTKKYSFVDFGPSKPLSNLLRKYRFLNYRSADLFRDDVDDKVDIENMPIYKDDSVDIFLCSHVLEHVKDDRKAIAELYRILHPGGWGIVMVPIVLSLSDVHEDPTIESDADRWKYFGNPDHLRSYSKQGFIARLEEVGFKVNQFGVNYFGADVFERHGIHERSVLYVVTKPLTASST
jgi:SAM-dependent methyltransferase